MGQSLSGRLLLLTLATVIVLEALIVVPLLSGFRVDYLEERLRVAHLASLGVMATPDRTLDGQLENELLARADADSIVLRRDGARTLVLSQVIPTPIDVTFDLRLIDWAQATADALYAFIAPQPRHIRVIGRPYPREEDEVEITLAEPPLVDAMTAFARRVLSLSLAVAAVLAALFFLLIRLLLVRPIERMVRSMTRFRDDPEDPRRAMRAQSRIREIAAAETALGDLQRQVTESLRERARLAALGEAVGKISHDLRNMLASVQLAADGIEMSRDPAARRAAPRLVRAIDRAIRLCETTLRFGKAEEAPSEIRPLDLRGLAAEVGETVFAEARGETAPQFENAVPDGLCAQADPEQLFRVLVNLTRNARQALESAGKGEVVRIEARAAADRVEIEVSDDGPGLPEKAAARLFEPFRGSTHKEGFGLGLAIARDLARMQGGSLELVESGPDGARFRVTLPAAAAQAA